MATPACPKLDAADAAVPAGSAPAAAAVAAPAAAPVLPAPAVAPPSAAASTAAPTAAAPSSAARVVEKMEKTRGPTPQWKVDRMPRMPNRPGEPEFKLNLTPNWVVFEWTHFKNIVWCDLKLKNTTAELQTFKVKCTSVEMFRVQPVFGFLKKDETVDIRLFYKRGKVPYDKHYFVVHHVAVVSGEGKDSKDLWTKSTKPDGVRRIGIIFNEC